MNSLKEHFHTDWSAMTATDWVGLSVTVGIFLALCAIYFYALRPKNRDRLEACRHIPFEEDSIVSGGRK